MILENILSKLIKKNLQGLLIESDNLPFIVPGQHEVKGNVTTPCDEFHGFQLKGIGDMNGKVSQKLEEFHNQGLNVWVTDVQVTPDLATKSVKWNVTIDKSSDGDYWNGFTSRGAGCNDNIRTRWNSKEAGQSKDDIVKKIIDKKVCKSVSEIELVKKVEFTNLGEFSFVQGFYRYKCPEKQKTKSEEITTSSPPKINSTKFDFETFEF